MRHYVIVAALVIVFIEGCNKQRTFTDDVAFLKEHVDVVVLKSENGSSQVAVVPDYQGRVMTSTINGKDSFGWLNYEAIASGVVQQHINVYGGEERFWLGPEGGQFALFFKRGEEFTLENWQTPPVIDTEAYDVVSKSSSQVTFQKDAHLSNMSGAAFDLKIDRKISLLNSAQVQKLLGVTINESVQITAFESDNKITNIGDNTWSKESGLLSIWLLGILKPSEGTTIVIPLNQGSEAELGVKVNDTYFGKVPSDKLVVKDDVLFFSGDGPYRSKIGVSPKRAKNIFGGYDATGKMLTLVCYTLPEGVNEYVNSMWEFQSEPFAGDVINSYNDGPPGPGKKPLGPFYELETSSPALALRPGQTANHTQQTIHIKGAIDDLDRIAQKTLGVTLDEITSPF